MASNPSQNVEMQNIEQEPVTPTEHGIVYNWSSPAERAAVSQAAARAAPQQNVSPLQRRNADPLSPERRQGVVANAMALQRAGRRRKSHRRKSHRRKTHRRKSHRRR
jgi:hypothetical protein